MTLGLYLPNILLSCVTAHCLSYKHSVFVVAEKVCKNLVVVIYNCDSMGKINFWLTFPDNRGDPDRKKIHKRRFAVNSKDCLSRESSGHASVPYNRMDKHLACIKASTHSSVRAHPTLPGRIKCPKMR